MEDPGHKSEMMADMLAPGKLIPARMLSEFAYCPRLCYIEWIDGEFVDSADTVDGRFQHRRVDSDEGGINEDEPEVIHARSISLIGEKVGISCRIDLLEEEGRNVTPVEYKRSKAPHIPEGAYEPDRVQLCAQGLVLRENNYHCDRGIIYFAASKKRVKIDFDKALVNRTKDLISELRSTAKSDQIPPPLKDSPKCVRCSLAGICLPDEINFLRDMDAGNKGMLGKIRRLVPPRDDSSPVYVIGHGNTVRKKGDCLEIWSAKKDGENENRVTEARLREISQVNLFGGVDISTPAVIDLMQRGIPILHFTRGGWFQGISLGHTHKNVELRIKQFAWAADRKKSLSIARCLIHGKIKNCRTQIRRNDSEPSAEVLERLDRLSKEAKNASSIEKLLGIEGTAAEVYFGRLDYLLKSDQGFSFQNRNRRPPKDPVNAVLSYLYAVLAKDLFVTLMAVGFDPYLGFYHQPKYGRPALALDMMEEFRPLIADSTAINLFNTRVLSERDFIKTAFGVSLTSNGKRKVIKGYEQRMETEINHLLFDYSISYRRIIEVQTRLLSRVLNGELKEYPPFCRR